MGEGQLFHAKIILEPPSRLDARHLIRERLSAETLHAALERGKSLDPDEVAKDLLAPPIDDDASRN